MTFAWVIGKTNNERVLALIHRTWCKTWKHTTMPEETFSKELDRECDTHKKIWLLLKHETCSQTSLIKIANLTYMQSSRLHSNCWKCPSLPFTSHAPKLELNPMKLLWNAKRLGFQHSTTSLVALLYLSLCSNAFMFKEQVFCSNAYKQALTTENEKTKSSQANEIMRKKICIDGHKLGTKLTWPWVSIQNQVWLPVQPLCIFFVPNFGFHPLFWPN